MLQLNIKGKIIEIPFKGKSSAGFVVKYGKGEILATIVHGRMELVDKVELEKEYCFIGEIGLYRNIKADNIYYSNTFYIKEIKEVKEEQTT